MASTTIQMHCDSASMPLSEIVTRLKDELDAELVFERQQHFDSASVLLLSCERYYFRNGSYASLTIMLTETDGQQTADIIGSGGGAGLFNISLGANTDFAYTAADLLKRCGFTEDD